MLVAIAFSSLDNLAKLVEPSVNVCVVVTVAKLFIILINESCVSAVPFAQKDTGITQDIKLCKTDAFAIKLLIVVTLLVSKLLTSS